MAIQPVYIRQASIEQGLATFVSKMFEKKKFSPKNFISKDPKKSSVEFFKELLAIDKLRGKGKEMEGGGGGMRGEELVMAHSQLVEVVLRGNTNNNEKGIVLSLSRHIIYSETP